MTAVHSSTFNTVTAIGHSPLPVTLPNYTIRSAFTVLFRHDSQVSLLLHELASYFSRKPKVSLGNVHSCTTPPALFHFCSMSSALPSYQGTLGCHLKSTLVPSLHFQGHGSRTFHLFLSHPFSTFKKTNEQIILILPLSIFVAVFWPPYLQ